MSKLWITNNLILRKIFLNIFKQPYLCTNALKELSFCHKLWFSNSYLAKNNLATHSLRPLIFQTINSVRSNSLSLKYQRFTSSGFKDIGVRKCKFVAKT